MMPSTLPHVRFENAGASVLASGIATFGQVFLQGEVPVGTALAGQLGGQTLAVQMDVKTRYADGSAKMVVLTMERPALATAATVDVALVPVAAKAAAALDLASALSGHSFVMDMQVHGGPRHQVDVLAELQKALTAGTADFWQKGDLATEARIEMALGGSQRVVFDVTAFKGGGFTVDAQFNNDVAMGAAGGTVSYDLSVLLDGWRVAQETVTQAQYQNFQRSFSSNGTDGGQGTGSPQAGWLNIKQDIAHLQATGAVAKYDLDLKLSSNVISNLEGILQAPDFGDALATNGVATYMPMTGGRGDIGFTTLSNLAWLNSQDPEIAKVALAQAQTAGAVPWNFWDAKAGTWLNTDAYPRLWTDGRGGTGTPGGADSGGLTQQVSGSTGWTPDTAHQPDLSYVPYLLTGQRWILDNLQAQAIHSVLATWPYDRMDGEAIVVNGGQVRGGAWSLRQIDEAAWASPEGSVEKAYFSKVSEQNWSWLVSKIPEWTAIQGEVHGYILNDPNSDLFKPWQEDYFASTTIAAAKHGNADALTFLKWQENFLIGRFLHDSDGFNSRDGVAYVLARRDSATGEVYDTWAEMGAATVARGWSNGQGWDRSGGDYAQLGMATLAGIYDLTGNPAAKMAYEAMMAKAPPYTDTSALAKDPAYAIAAPGKTPLTGIQEGAAGSQPSLPPVVVTPPPVVGPPVVGLPEAGAQPVALAIVLGAESWNGHPIAVVKVDGIEVFRGEITAQHAQGGQVKQLGLVDGSKAHSVTVQFVNDGYGGTAATDRNLHVEDVLLNGVSQGMSRALLWNSTESLVTAPLKAVPVVTPPPVMPPAQDVLKIGLSADVWNGGAEYAILLDGKQVGDIRTTTAKHDRGEQDFVELKGNFKHDEHTLTVRYLNDDAGGTAGADRNLYVSSMSLNGADMGKSANLMSNGDATFKVPGGLALPAPVIPTPGQPAAPADDVLQISLSGDFWRGAPRYALLIDGQQVGGERMLSAQHGRGVSETIELQGDFSSSQHSLSVRFLNDAWGGSAATDRNLYLDGIKLNGQDLNASAKFSTNGEATFKLAPPAGRDGAPAPALDEVVTLGAGPDHLKVVLSQDLNLPEVRFQLFVDSMQVGGTYTSLASRSRGETDTFDIRGDFGEGLHALTVYVLDWGAGTTKGNVYVEQLAYNDVTLGVATPTHASADFNYIFG